MIVVQIHSGLGNQLFMYAAARALAHKHGTALTLDVDTDCRNGLNHGSDVGHSFQLDRFNISAGYPGRREGDGQASSHVARYSALKARLRDNHLARAVARKLRDHGIDLSRMLLKVSGNEKRFFSEPYGDWGYKPQVMELPDNTILRGCFFSYKYFAPIRGILLSELTLREPLSPRSREVEATIDDAESVSLHVRRGDVATNPEYRSWYEGIVTAAYYRNAVMTLQERLHDPRFFVFSDEIDWARAHLDLPARTVYVGHNGPAAGYEDLHLMARCKHNITTGFSSFSWWGAWLNRNPAKIVVRTRRMNALDHLNHPQDFFPPEWVVAES